MFYLSRRQSVYFLPELTYLTICLCNSISFAFTLKVCLSLSVLFISFFLSLSPSLVTTYWTYVLDCTILYVYLVIIPFSKKNILIREAAKKLLF